MVVIVGLGNKALIALLALEWTILVTHVAKIMVLDVILCFKCFGTVLTFVHYWIP